MPGLATSQNGFVGHQANGSASRRSKLDDELLELNLQLKTPVQKDNKFHGDDLIGDARKPTGAIADWENSADDFRRILTWENLPSIAQVAKGFLLGKGLDIHAGAKLIGSMSNDSHRRAAFTATQVAAKYNRMLHPPLTYLGDAFQYRTADGKFNSAINPHLGQAGAPYAKTVPSVTHPLGALPDPGDIFDRLMAREEGGRISQSGLSSMLIYHATIIIHDIFRTNDNDKNISDSSSYLDLSPLYGYTMEMQRKIRDDDYKLGLLKPDTFAEDRLLRQPPGVCIMLVMYNRYHNYAATQLRRINENGRFSVPSKYEDVKLVAVAKHFKQNDSKTDASEFEEACKQYKDVWKAWMAKNKPDKDQYHTRCEEKLKNYYSGVDQKEIHKFEAAYDAAWNKLDDDLFNTARLITCGMYVQISVHDYLRALMGFHQYNTNFTLDPRNEIDHRNVSRGLGNQVTVEFNLLYRFHCAISLRDEQYTEKYISKTFGVDDPKKVSIEQYLGATKHETPKTEPKDVTFGIPYSTDHFGRNKTTNLFDDDQMLKELTAAMDEPISNFGPRNIPKCMKAIEIMGILQARKWEVGTLNDFRAFFGMPRHDTFESISKNVEIQNALRDLYEHPDKVELYPGIFCESDANMGVDPGPSDVSSALWAAIFSDAITLVRSDRFYTVDWNTNSLTSWGMKEVTPDNDNLKSSVFHRLLQRAFPGWYPYNSVRFFHPFYTAQQNAKFAEEQGYGLEFRVSKKERLNDTDPEFDVSDSNPKKPTKPIYLDDIEQISAVLNDKSYLAVHPAFADITNFPVKIQTLFISGKKADGTFKTAPKPINIDRSVPENSEAIMKYFNELMREIIKREAVTMSNTTYQIDVTRDFAIPVISRYVADFLGFGHRIRTTKQPHGSFSENEIYRHITNCQTFLSYSVDETKLLKRRKAFRLSFNFLFELTRSGNVHEANRWVIGQALLGRKRDNPMTELGFKIAQRVLSHRQNPDEAAAILLFVGLHAAYNSVLTFTSVLHSLIGELYDPVQKNQKKTKHPQWTRIEALAVSDDKKSDEEITEIVMAAQRASVKFPVIRTMLRDHVFRNSNGSTVLEVKENQKIICDIYKANQKAQKSGQNVDAEALNYQYSFTDQFADYRPKHLAVVGFTAMIKMIARMKNVRRGHSSQGRLKHVNIDESSEGYSNYMAPMRIARIKHEVEKLGSKADQVYNTDVLKPSVDTFMTPEWDEMIPFPTTWKIRFDGFGKSTYEPGFPRDQRLPDDFPPFYQPQGPSHVGGTFADVACICNTPDKVCLCKGPVPSNKDPQKKDEGTKTEHTWPAVSEPTVSKGCRIPGH